MKTATKVALSLVSLFTGCGCSVAAFDHAFAERDRRDASYREIARIVSETDADRRDAAIVASLVGVR